MSNLNYTKPFLLHANVKLVDGFLRSIILDLQHNKNYFIPNSLYSILKEHEKKSINEIKPLFPGQENTIIEYFVFLVKNDLIFFSEKTDSFPKLSSNFSNSSHITNVVLEHSKFLDYPNLVGLFNKLNCRSVSIFFDNSITRRVIENVLLYFDDSSVAHIDVVATNLDDTKGLDELFFKQSRLQKFVISNSDVEKEIDIKNGLGREIIFTKKTLNIKEGRAKRRFNIHLNTYLESINRHTYFNQKLFIDSKGTIKNAPECEETFGNIKEIQGFSELSNKR